MKIPDDDYFAGCSSSKFSFVSNVERAMLFCTQEKLSHLLPQGHWKHTVVKIVEREVFARIIGLLLPVAAALDILYHGVMAVATAVYCAGRWLFQRECDFTLPLEHIQRVRDAIFPLFFGGLCSVIHPYLGVWASEPAKKQALNGFMVGKNSDYDAEVVCSPLTALCQAKEIVANLSNEISLDGHAVEHLKKVRFWEGEMEKVQSIDFFHFKITRRVAHWLMQEIDELNLPAKALLKRITLVAYPILVTLDLLAMIAATVVCVALLPVRLLGGRPPAYFEKAASFEVIITNIVKIPLFLVGMLVGLVLYPFSPKHAVKATHLPTEFLARILFEIKFLGIRYKMWRMTDHDQMVLPIVNLKDESDAYPLLPAFNSHMRYLIVQRDGDAYTASLCCTGKFSHTKQPLDRKRMQAVVKDLLLERLEFAYHCDAYRGERDFSQVESADTEGAYDKGLKNCVVQNIFLMLRHLNDCDMKGVFQAARAEAVKRSSVYSQDHGLFAPQANYRQAARDNGDTPF